MSKELTGSSYTYVGVTIVDNQWVRNGKKLRKI